MNASALADVARSFAERGYVETGSIIGFDVLNRLLRDVFNEKDLEFGKGVVHIKAPHPEQAISSFVRRTSERMRYAFGDQVFETVLEKAWKEVTKQSYSQDILAGLLDLTPQDFLVEPKVKYLSRENLET